MPFFFVVKNKAPDSKIKIVWEKIYYWYNKKGGKCLTKFRQLKIDNYLWIFINKYFI